jgi:hypothetical protein
VCGLQKGDVPLSEQSVTIRGTRLLRNWWPIVAFLVPVAIVQTIWSAQYDVAGHAAAHLSSATTVFAMVFASAVLLWALPERGRRNPWLWLLFAAAIGGSLVVMAGNLQVVDAIGGETWTDAQASRLGPARPGFESGHDLASQGARGVVLAAILAAGLLWRLRLVSAKAAAGSAGLSLIFPPWIAPGFGIVILVISAVLARARRLKSQT